MSPDLIGQYLRDHLSVEVDHSTVFDSHKVTVRLKLDGDVISESYAVLEEPGNFY